MVGLQFNKRQDKYFITNTEASDITYVVQKLSNCNEYLDTDEGVIQPDEEVEIVLKTDGEYQIIVTNEADEETTITIKHYLELQLSMIQDVYAVLCECGCGCSDCVKLNCDSCTALMIARAKMDAYKRVMNPQYVSFFNAVYQEVKCMLDQEIYCCIVEEKIKGSSKFNETFMKKLLALDFLAIYFYEIFTDCDDESCDEDYVRNKFKADKIMCCISKLGIDIKEIETLIDDSMGTLTINSAAYVNQPPDQVGDNTIAVANRAVTTLTLAMFTTGTTPAYNDPEGDPVQDVRIDAIPADGLLELDGVAVSPGDIIPVADINSNLLVYTSPNQDALDSDDIQFSLRDTGSGQFSS